MVIDLGLQPFDQRLDLLPQAEHSLPTDDLGIEDRPDSADCLVEVVVDDDVLVLLDGLQFVQSGI